MACTDAGQPVGHTGYIYNEELSLYEIVGVAVSISFCDITEDELELEDRGPSSFFVNKKNPFLGKMEVLPNH